MGTTIPRLRAAMSFVHRAGEQAEVQGAQAQGHAEVARGGDLQRRKESEPQRRQEGRPEEAQELSSSGTALAAHGHGQQVFLPAHSGTRDAQDPGESRRDAFIARHHQTRGFGPEAGPQEHRLPPARPVLRRLLPGTFKAGSFEELALSYRRSRLHVVHHYVHRAQKYVRGWDLDARQPKDKMTGRHFDSQGELVLAADERGSAP